MKVDIRSLTGLRGIAAGMVVLYHFWPASPSLAPGIALAISKGYLWVDLFFVLSGYVLALNYGSLFAEQPFSPRTFAFFFARRVARIYPAYFVLLVLQLGFVLLMYGNFGESHHWGGAEALVNPIRDVPANILLVQSAGLAPSVIGQAWSVSTEFVVYCAFPPLVTLAVFGGRRAAALALISAGLLLVAVVLGDAKDGAKHAGALDAYDGTHFTPLMRCLGDFILGLLAFRAGQRGLFARLFAHDAVGAGLLVALPLMFASGMPDLAIVALFPALVLCLASNNGMPARLFSNASMVRLGELSYAIYLSHPLLQAPMDAACQGLERVLPVLPAVLLSRGAALAVAWVVAGAIYRWIERPGRQVLRNFEPMRRVAAG